MMDELQVNNHNISQNQFHLLDSFFIVGNDANKSSQFIDVLFPTILSSFSIKGNTEEYSILLDLFNNDPILSKNIFPNKLNYLTTLDFTKDEDSITIGIKPETYKDNYIKSSYQKPLFHYFLYQYTNPPNYFMWYFHCLIYWERRFSENKVYYIAQAMIIITKEPLFCLCHDVLFDIYNRLNNSNSFVTPLEPFIIQLFSQLQSSSTNRLDILINNQIKYQTVIDPFISLCDLNYSLFFQLFTVKDVLFLSEQFLRRNTIIITSTSHEFLYPLYHIFMTLIHPLDIIDSTYLYRLLTIEFLPTFISQFPVFTFIYIDEIPDENFFINIANKKNHDISVVTIDHSTTNKMNNLPFVITKKFYHFIDQNNIQSSVFPMISIIEKVLIKTLKENTHYFNLINSKLKDTLENNPSDSNYFFNLKKVNYNDLRKLFFGLIIKFFVSIIPETCFKVYNNQIKFDFIEKTNLIEQDDDISSFFNDFSSSPSFDIFYKNNNDINNANIKNMILLDELLKITQIDPNRLYYDFESLNYQMISSSILSVNTLKIYYTKQLLYNNKYHKIMLRNILTPLFHLSSTNNSFIYDSFVLYFNEFKDEHIQLQNKSKEPQIDILIYEIECFYNLLMTNTIPFQNHKEYFIGLIGIFLTLYILNDTAKANLFHHLMSMLIETKGFYKKFSIIISLMYEIMISNQIIFDQYFKQFMTILSEYAISPTYSIYLKYNNKIRSTLEPNKHINNIFKKVKGNLIELDDCKIHGNLNELNINLCCAKCDEPISLKLIQEKEERQTLLIHPKDIIERLLTMILKNKTVILNHDTLDQCFYDDLGIISFISSSYYYNLSI